MQFINTQPLHLISSYFNIGPKAEAERDKEGNNGTKHLQNPVEL